MQMPANIGPFHIIGIGGIGMSASIRDIGVTGVQTCALPI